MQGSRPFSAVTGPEAPDTEENCASWQSERSSGRVLTCVYIHTVYTYVFVQVYMYNPLYVCMSTRTYTDTERGRERERERERERQREREREREPAGCFGAVFVFAIPLFKQVYILLFLSNVFKLRFSLCVRRQPVRHLFLD